MSIVTWEYYSSLHTAVNKNDFDRSEAIAEKEVELVVGKYRWDRIDSQAFYFNQLQDCICNVIDKMAADVKSGKGNGLSSVSNDGYSESYVIQTEEQLRSELQGAIRAWLSGTGLAGAF